MKNLSLIILLFCCSSVFAQSSSEKVKNYIKTYKSVAIDEMNRTGIPASITLAQGILESAWGKSRLATIGNNHFGIKCHTGWKGGTMKHDDDAIDECFRTYKNAKQSYKDHSDFLTGRARYEFIFQYDKTDYVNWAKGLKKAGYATNPKYAEMLIEKIERYNLHIYDKKDWKKREATITLNEKMSTGEIVYDYSIKHSKIEEEPVFASSNDVPYKPKVERIANTTQPTGLKSEKKQRRIKPVVEIRKKKKPEEKILTNTEINEAFDKGDVVKEKGTYNHVKFIKLKYPASPYKISKTLNVKKEKIIKWNEVSENYRFKANSKVFLGTKKNRPIRGIETHTVKKGETIYDISNKYCVKVIALYKRNNIKIPRLAEEFPEPLEEGRVLQIKRQTSF